MIVSGSHDAVVFVLVDALRHDYVGRTRFLADLARRSLTGRLEEPFGFCPRGAYFGGLDVEEQGFSNLFHFDPENSVFRWTRQIAGTGNDAWVRRTLHDEIVRRARRQLPEFSAAYVDPVRIPLEWLNFFDVSEREAPWSPRVGYRSLFHILDQTKRPWMEVSWPFGGLDGVVNDHSVTKAALDRMNGEHAFVFLHLPDLDAAGHYHGPGGVGLQRALEETDALCARIAERAMEVYRNPVVVFSGDHGMLPVIRAVDAGRALRDAGLEMGLDCAYFIDSTMVRFWFFHEQARARAWSAMENAGGGHWLSLPEKQRWKISGLAQRNGEELFLADPGVVFSPSFFDDSGAGVPRGMHGYAPDVMDNRAAFLAHSPRFHWSGDVGEIEARRLFPSFLRWLGLPGPEPMRVPPIVETEAHVASRRWTKSVAPGADEVVSLQLGRAVEAIRGRAPETRAVLVYGSFGRGEGTVVSDEQGVRAVNDYDLLAIGAPSGSLDGLGPELAREFRIDFVDAGACRELASATNPTQLEFDIRYGSTLAWGDLSVLNDLRHYAPAEVERSEGTFLFCNRLGGLLLGLADVAERRHDATRFLTHQVAKIYIAAADAWLLSIGDYHASYEVRRRRFASLAPAASFSPQVVGRIDGAFNFKLRSQAFDLGDVNQAVMEVRQLMTELVRAMAWGADLSALWRELAVAARIHVLPSERWLAESRRFGLAAKLPAGSEGLPLVVALYRSIVALLFSWTDEACVRRDAVAASLSPAWDLSDECKTTELPRAIGTVWYSVFFG